MKKLLNQKYVFSSSIIFKCFLDDIKYCINILRFRNQLKLCTLFLHRSLFSLFGLVIKWVGKLKLVHSLNCIY